VTNVSGKVLDTPNGLATHRSLRQSGGVDSYRDRASTPPRHAPYDLAHHLRHIGRIKPSQKAMKRSVVGNRVQFERGPQLRVFAQTNSGLAKGPILLAHQAKHGQQLWLRELPFTELRAPRRQNRLTDLKSQTGKPTSPTSAIVLAESLSNFRLTRIPRYGIPTYRGCQLSQPIS
jgi:hypothetical protein